MPQKALTLSRKVHECKPLARGAPGGTRALLTRAPPADTAAVSAADRATVQDAVTVSTPAAIHVDTAAVSTAVQDAVAVSAPAAFHVTAVIHADHVNYRWNGLRSCDIADSHCR
jgi:Tfp pilus assembly protein PilW